MTYKFFDTSALLYINEEELLKEDSKIVISTITLQELEALKLKDIYLARQVLRLLDTHEDKYEVYMYKLDMLIEIYDARFEVTNDTRILATAIAYDKEVHPDEVVFVTNDRALKHIANVFFGADSVISYTQQCDDYCGYKKVYLNDEELSDFYQNINYNHFNLYINQYLIIEDAKGQLIDKLCWDGHTHRALSYNIFDSKQLGKVKPIKGDAQQIFAADSLVHNQITMLRGPAGSGKTMLSLGYLFYKLENHEIDKIVIFCNTVATKDSAKLGFYPGTRDQKLLDSQIGNLLSSKLGSQIEVERMIHDEKLVLLPLSDIRGYDTTGMRAGIYISEAQNMTIDLMKLALQRIGEDSICIIDGDDKTQVDSVEFAGENNGMKRLSKVFRGADFYGEIELKNIHRSKIAELAQNL